MAPKTALLPPPTSRSETIACANLFLDDLQPTPWENPREKISDDSVRQLAQTIEIYGLLQPVVVMPAPKKGFYLLAGYRRVAALRLLGRKSCVAHELKVSDKISSQEIAAQVAIVENEQREALDPIREAAVVEQLLARETSSLESVAVELGRSISWVQHRAGLVKLSKTARAERKKDGLLSDWPTAWLEELALLPPSDQDALIKLQEEQYNRPQSLSTLREVVRQRLQRLGAAPWKLDDAELVPAAGSCAKCKKQSAAQPELFGDVKKVELAAARCLDSACWSNKLKTWSDRAIVTAREKYGSEILLLAGPAQKEKQKFGPHVDYDAEDLARGIETERLGDEEAAVAFGGDQKGLAVRSVLDVIDAKKGDKGAVPALIVEGVGAGSVRYVKERPKGSKAKSAAGGRVMPKAKPKTLAQKRASLEKRRKLHVVEAVVLQLDDWSDKKEIPPAWIKAAKDDPQWVLDLVAAFGCDGGFQIGPKEAAKLLDGGGIKFDANAGLLPRIFETILEKKLDERKYNPAEPYEWARALYCSGLELEKEWKALVQAAEVEIPTPRAWTAGEKVEPKKKPAKNAKAFAGNQKLAKAAKKISGKDAAAGEREEDE